LNVHGLKTSNCILSFGSFSRSCCTMSQK
jgi:hypothetical protein